MSITLSSGLVGVSTHTTLVSWRIAARNAERSVMSTTSWATPQSASTRARSRYVPPYTSFESNTWSSGRSVRRSVASAAIPDAKQSPWRPPSSDASTVSRAPRVGVLVPAPREVEPLRLPHLRLRVRGRLEDGDVHGAEHRFWLLAGVDRPGLEPH